MQQHYKKNIHEYHMGVETEMMQCHLQDECDSFDRVSTQNKEQKKLHQLYNDDGLYMIFEHNRDFVKMYIQKSIYNSTKDDIRVLIMSKYIIYLLVLLVISVLFSLYSIRPLKKALKINEEFVKDILHDFNTPLTTIGINHKILKKQFGESDALVRSDEAISNILSLQSNLHYFLKQSKLKNGFIDLKSLLNKRTGYFKRLFPDLEFILKMDDSTIFTNENAFVRVLDNLIENACKYNKSKGFIKISLQKRVLKIEDSGIGIINIDKIFERYYKESDRGFGIGLHVVKKLCDELDIRVTAKSQQQKGTIFSLDFNRLIEEKKSK
jgi:signal transduction histidine kinase